MPAPGAPTQQLLETPMLAPAQAVGFGGVSTTLQPPASSGEPMEVMARISGESAELRVGTCSPLRNPTMPLERFGIVKLSHNQKSPVPNIERQVLLMHMRKAGGTTLRRWLDAACQILKNTTDCAWVREGASINDPFYLKYLVGPNAKITIAIVNIREPMARTQSLVNMNIQQREKTCDVQDATVLASDLCRANNSVDAELQRIRECYSIPSDKDATTLALYKCGADVYVKALAGTSDDHYVWRAVATKLRNVPMGELFWGRASSQDLERAKQRLRAFHGVAIIEWVNLVAFEDYMSKIVLGLHNRLPFKSAYRTQYEKASGASTKFTPEQMRTAELMNEQDLKLYDYAKRLVLQRMVDAGYC